MFVWQNISIPRVGTLMNDRSAYFPRSDRIQSQEYKNNSRDDTENDFGFALHDEANLLFNQLRLNPFVVFLDKVHEAVHGLGFGDVELDGLLADVEVDLAGRTAHIAEVCVRHF